MCDELKPCPFCGGRANDWEYEDEQDVFDPTSMGWIDTRCVTWHCAGCESCEIEIARLSRDDAAAAWNARAEPTLEQRCHQLEQLARDMYVALIYCSNGCSEGCPMLGDGCAVASEELRARLEELGVILDD